MSAAPEVVIEAGRADAALRLRDVFRYRALLASLARRLFKQRYQELRFNVLWFLARPAVMTAVFTTLGVGRDAGGTPFPLYVFSGLCFWFAFQEMVVLCADSLKRDAGLIQKVYYPVVISPLSALLARSVDLGLALVAVAALQVFFGVWPGPAIVLLPLFLAMLLALAFGLGCLFAALSLAFPDARRVLDLILYLGLFLSPTVYTIDAAGRGGLAATLAANPMTGVLEGLRGALFGTAVPWSHVVWSAGATGLLLAAGWLLFARAGRNVSENL